MKEITLPSGKKAVIRDGKGKDLLNAQRIAQSPDEIIYALLAELVMIDGTKHVYEDVLEMPLTDVLVLQGEITGNFIFASQGILSSSQGQQAGDSQK